MLRASRKDTPIRPLRSREVAAPRHSAMADSAAQKHEFGESPAPPSILDRPASERRREFKYRFAQSVVFGAPVLALEWFGRGLGGPEADRWVSLFEALLAGWVVYVAAAGMLSEGALLVLARRERSTVELVDLLIGVLAALAYAAGLPRLVILLTGHTWAAAQWPHTFQISVATLAVWTGLRWWTLAKKNSAG